MKDKMQPTDVPVIPLAREADRLAVLEPECFVAEPLAGDFQPLTERRLTWQS
jgi:hypothetical protein